MCVLTWPSTSQHHHAAPPTFQPSFACLIPWDSTLQSSSAAAAQLCSGRAGLPARLCLVRFGVQSANAVTRRWPAPRSDCILLHFTPAQPRWLELHSKPICAEDPPEAACKWKASEALHHQPLTRIIAAIQIRGSGSWLWLRPMRHQETLELLGALTRSSVSSQQSKTRKNDKERRWWADGLPLPGEISKRQHRGINKHFRQPWREVFTSSQFSTRATRQEPIRQKSNGSRLDSYLRAICWVKYWAVDKENEAGEKDFLVKREF